MPQSPRGASLCSTGQYAGASHHAVRGCTKFAVQVMLARLVRDERLDRFEQQQER